MVTILDFKIGEWVKMENRDILAEGYITYISYVENMLHVYITKCNNKKYIGFTTRCSLDFITKLDETDLSIDDLKDAIDISLDLKNKPLFYQFSNLLLKELNNV